jgi:chromosomal replication initiator protein
VDVSLDRTEVQVNDAEKMWTEAGVLLRQQVSEGVWMSTFQQVTPLRVADGVLHLMVPSGHVRDRVIERYYKLVVDSLADAGEADMDIVLVLPPEQGQLDLSDPEHTASAPGFGGSLANGGQVTDPGPGSHGAAGWNAVHALDASTTNGATTNGATTNGAAMVGVPAAPDADPRDGDALSTFDKYTFDTFVTGSSNRFAAAAAMRVAETPARSYNPLFIYGSAGLGKTHLLRAIGNYVREQYQHYRVSYVSTETFLNEFVDAIRTSSQSEFKRRYREVDVLMIDDIQFMEGKEGLQEEFFHTFNSLHGGGKQIVISSDRNPDSIHQLEDRLKSRFKWGLITDIQPPDLETRLAILRAKVDTVARNVPVPAEVLELIASGITTNIRELEGALIRITALASLTREPVTVELAQSTLREVFSSNQPQPLTAKRIITVVSDALAVTEDDLRGKSRHRPLVTARQIAMFLCRDLTDLSFPAIAREFGGRDHTTVIHAVEKITAQMAERQQIFDQVTALTQKLRAGL